MKIEFEAFPKIGRLKRPIVISEKLDGTNAQILITSIVAIEDPYVCTEYSIPVTYNSIDYLVMFASRNKYIKVGDDNYGFAAHFTPLADKLVEALGEGRHYGEWWGKGVARGYGLTEKRLSLFNTMRWEAPEQRDRLAAVGIHVVPTLYHGPMTDTSPYLQQLREKGSVASPGYMDPEGIIVYHMATRTLFKETLDKDEEPKGKHT